MVKAAKRAFALMLALLCLLAISAAPAEEIGLVNDEAGLYTAAEIAQMEAIISRIRTKYQMDAVVLTTNDVPYSYGDDSVTVAWADAWYENHGCGLGQDRAGILLILDMTNRYNYLSTAGVMIDYMSDSRIESVLTAADDDLHSGRYGRAMIAELRQLEAFCAEGIEEGNFRYDEVTGERLTGLYNKLTRREAILAGAGGLGAALILILTVTARYGLKGGTYHYPLKENASVQMTRDDEVFQRQTVHRTRISSGGGGGRSGGGHSGGSGVHFSSGGMSHGGGGHHF